MKIGIKLHTTNFSLYKDAIAAIENRLADYLELTYLQSETTDLEVLRESGIPIVIHVAHAGQGTELSGSEIGSNIAQLELAVRAADVLEAKFIIVHPDKGKVENFVKVVSAFGDSRILVENMPKIAMVGGDCVGFFYEELKYIMKKCSCGLCLDFGHAFKAANSLNIDFTLYCEQLMKLQPSMFHIAQGRSVVEHDEHLDLNQGDIDLSYVKRLVDGMSFDSFVTVEVPFQNGITNCLNNICYLKGIE